MANTTQRWIGGDSGNENDYNTAANWDSASVPISTDFVIIPATSTYSIDGYDASAVDLKGFLIEAGYDGTIGTNRATPLMISLLESATYYDFVCRSTSGQKFISLTDWGDAYIEGAPPAPGIGEYGLYLTGTMGASSGDDAQVFVNASDGASIGLGPNKGDECDFNQIFVTGGDVTLGPDAENDDGGNTTIIYVTAGTFRNYGAIAGLLQYGGTVYLEGTGAVATVGVYEGAELFWKNATITTLNIYNRATVDCRASHKPRTVTTLHFYGPGGTWNDPSGIITITNPFQLHNTRLSEITFNGPIDRTYDQSG